MALPCVGVAGYVEIVKQVVPQTDYCDAMRTTVDDPPFDLCHLAALSQKGIGIGIVTAPDYTTNPPGMQEWVHKQIRESKFLVVEMAGATPTSLRPAHARATSFRGKFFTYSWSVFAYSLASLLAVP